MELLTYVMSGPCTTRVHGATRYMCQYDVNARAEGLQLRACTFALPLQSAPGRLSRFLAQKGRRNLDLEGASLGCACMHIASGPTTSPAALDSQRKEGL